MAIGGGAFTAQNKALPGTYINFVSASSAGIGLSDRGTLAMPLSLDWGPEGEVFTVSRGEFLSGSLKTFGYEYSAAEMSGLRDVFRNAREGHFYRLETGGSKAHCELCEAKYPGKRGNDISIAVKAAAGGGHEVLTYMGSAKVDSQTVSSMGQLKDNGFVSWNAGASLNTTAGLSLSGGSNGGVETSNYQAFLDKIEGYAFNILGLVSNDDTLKNLFASYTETQRDTVGKKFQCVLYRYDGAGSEGVISVENAAKGDVEEALAYWASGALAGCAVNESLTNALYGGEIEIEAGYTSRELEQAIKDGRFILHMVNGQPRVLEDINTYVEFTDSKGSDFAQNQVVRVLDQIASDIAAVFSSRYLGKVPNDNAGRISLWGDIVKLNRQLEAIRAIAEYDSGNLTVEKGESRNSVVVNDQICPTGAMARLYMTVIVE